MGIIKSVFKYIHVFMVVLGLLFSLLIFATLIPRNAIKENVLESAEYMCEKRSIFEIVDYLRASRIDRYADSITISIGYYLDENNPVTSSMIAAYYGEQSARMNQKLLEGVSMDSAANLEYLRYWHGSAGLIRFLHLFWDIKTIYIFHAVLMAGLYALLIIELVKKGMLPEATAFTLSLIIVSVWYVPFCLEYTWMFLVMLVSAIISIQLSEKHIGVFFMITGMVAAYLDFLTTETLTLLVPLLFILRIRSRQEASVNWVMPVKSCVSWGAGFIGMWISKWILASVILGENVMPYVTEHIDERLGGYVGVPQENYVTAAIAKNIKCLFPYEYGIYGALLVFVFIIVAVIIPVMKDKVMLRRNINISIMLIYVVLALVPFVRFAVLRNHSYIHYFFTHRALASTILALCFIILELVQLNPRKAVMKNA